MKKNLLLSLGLCLVMAAQAQDEVTIDISGNNTSSNYVSYNQDINIADGQTVTVKMARYCYFSSRVSGSNLGVLNLYGGGERCYLGTASGKTWADLNGFFGIINIYPFKENSGSADSYGVVLAHGGKSSSADNALKDLQAGKVNATMQWNKVVLHSGATMACEANSAGAGFCMGELDTEEGSTLQGYIKKQRSAYYLVGGINSGGLLAGTIAPTDYRDDTQLGIVKQGKGTYRITGNDNYLSGALRILDGAVMINNDRAAAESGKKRGALGAMSSESKAVAYVFSGGLLGGTGSIGGSVDNYGTIEPGDNATGTLTLRNYFSPTKQSHLTLHPASVLRFKVAADSNDLLSINGSLKYDTNTDDFDTSDEQPVITIVVNEQFNPSVGDEFTVLKAKSKTGDWQFLLRQPGRFTWKLVEEQTTDAYILKLRVTSLTDATEDPDNPDGPEDSETHMGAFYDDGIDDSQDNNTLRHYAALNKKNIGVALSTWKAGAEEGGLQFNMMVAENEMKMDALRPSRNEYSFGSADALVNIAQNNNMAIRGHCLVWHMQQPAWLSSDGKKNDKNWSRTEALSIMKEHINTVMQHFKGKVTEWDVVNECLDDDQSIVRTNPDGYTLRPTVWSRAIGDDYIDSAFVYAHRADPTTVLYLNDYDVELQGTAKAAAFYNLVAHLRQKNIPIDGVGLQCHFSVNQVDSMKLERTIRRFGEAGLKCIITELDMGIPSTSEQDLEEQARCYRVVTDIMLNNDNCPSMVIWGVKDNDSWRSASNPLLYDAGQVRKMAWYAVRSALRHRYIINGKPDVTVIKDVQHKTSEDKGAIYDLQGHRVSGEMPGLYIRHGRKWIVK
jgi:GH35 family endo-1,4-beta-xylanase